MILTAQDFDQNAYVETDLKNQELSVPEIRCIRW